MSNQLDHLLQAGQSVWLDNLRRGMFASGELQALIDKGLRGMTSNPTIFEKAIGAGNDYDEQLKSLVGKEHDASTLFWDLAIKDIQSACDAFRPLYDRCNGDDGFVSLEVSPLLANDTQGTIDMAKHLWKRVDRPNLMVKIPGTNAGVPAIEACIAEGININVTLVFAVEYYEKTAMAFVRGLEQRVAKGLPIDRIRSVNSVFVSRIDTAIDKLLQARIDKGEKQLEQLLGKAGVANLKLTYQKFLEIFTSPQWGALAEKGGHRQRPLWASTSTKNPQYYDLMYVEPVVGKDTVNTMPPQTLDALLDHGKIQSDTVLDGLDEARAVMKQLADNQISFYDVTYQLQVDGVKLFSDSWGALLGAIVYKQKQLSSGGERVKLDIGAYQTQYESALARLSQNDFLKKLWAKDPSVWSSEASHAEIIKHSLGWLDIPQRMLENVANLREFAKEAAAEFKYVVVLGMGGSSLAPDIMCETFGQTTGYPQLLVLDSTDPQQIRELDEQIDVEHSLFIVASKSGTTTEPDAFYRYYCDRVSKAVGANKCGRHFVAITDPGTQLEEEAKSQNFRACFLNDPNIGGRYSALSFFGMVPAALAGYDVNLLLDRGLGALHANDKTVAPDSAPGVRFGAAIGALALAGRTKLTIVTHPAIEAFGAWAEQLIAESTGKNGRGILPVEGEALAEPGVYGDDRVFVYVGDTLPDGDSKIVERLRALAAAGHPVIRLAMNDTYDTGEQFYLWEIATAAAGSLLEIDAFDQPNVQESKDNTKALLKQYAETGRFDEPQPAISTPGMDISFLSGSKSIQASDAQTALAQLFNQVKPGDYVAFCAYIARNGRHIDALNEMRLKVRDARHVATTVGFGPRFLHSTGQEHKGGPGTGVFVQITAESDADLPVPGMHIGFRTLIAAQALGDLQSLDKRNRRGVRVKLKGDLEHALRELNSAIDDALTAKA
ncbi:MAG TPA: bifunctional transaldolase/phosoglucose isomerase [Candidatus Baltobacteraceae bacterium]|jgi:transaldolase/glucose-6-phosphate isomerase|nr:bifunctional transaldolase/phosoglucose isomerase [Candidatus Baltobacteraceae bacterium]